MYCMYRNHLMKSISIKINQNPHHWSICEKCCGKTDFLLFYKKLNQRSKDNYSSNEQLTLCASQSEGQQDVATITTPYCMSQHPQYTMLLFDHSYHSWGYSSLSWNSSKWYQEGNSIPPIVYLPWRWTHFESGWIWNCTCRDIQKSFNSWETFPNRYTHPLNNNSIIHTRHYRLVQLVDRRHYKPWVSHMWSL